MSQPEDERELETARLARTAQPFTHRLDQALDEAPIEVHADQVVFAHILRVQRDHERDMAPRREKLGTLKEKLLSALNELRTARREMGLLFWVRNAFFFGLGYLVPRLAEGSIKELRTPANIAVAFIVVAIGIGWLVTAIKASRESTQIDMTINEVNKIEW